MNTETTDRTLERALTDTQERYGHSQAREQQHREERNAAVIAALDAGWSLQKIKDHTGLSRTRIQQIKHGGK